jgi:hypothetical protein
MNGIKRYFPKVSRKTVVPYAIGVGMLWALMKPKRFPRFRTASPNIAVYDAVGKQV